MSNIEDTDIDMDNLMKQQQMLQHENQQLAQQMDNFMLPSERLKLQKQAEHMHNMHSNMNTNMKTKQDTEHDLDTDILKSDEKTPEELEYELQMALEKEKELEEKLKEITTDDILSKLTPKKKDLIDIVIIVIIAVIIYQPGVSQLISKLFPFIYQDKYIIVINSLLIGLLYYLVKKIIKLL